MVSKKIIKSLFSKFYSYSNCFLCFFPGFIYHYFKLCQLFTLFLFQKAVSLDKRFWVLKVSLVVYMCIDLAIFGLTFGLSLGCRSISLTQQKSKSGSDDLGCVHRIKLCSVPEIFLYCVETKEYCEQKEALEFFLLR